MSDIQDVVATEVSVTEQPEPPPPPRPTTVAATQTPQVLPKLSDMDRMSLELAKSTRKLALAQAEKALAQNEAADLAYKIAVLQLYLKYGLTDQDAIDESGNILKGAAVQR